MVTGSTVQKCDSLKVIYLSSNLYQQFQEQFSTDLQLAPWPVFGTLPKFISVTLQWDEWCPCTHRSIVRVTGL